MQTTKRTMPALALLALAGIASLSLLFAPVASTLAQAPAGSMTNPSPSGDQVTIDNPAFQPLGETNVQGIIGRIIKFILGLTGVIALVMFIYGGFLWMTAAGSSDGIEKAKGILLWSTIGIIIIFSAYAIVDFVINLLT